MHETYYNKKKQQRKNLKSCKRKVIPHIKGSSHKILRTLLSRNISSQKGVGCYIQSDKRKKTKTNNNNKPANQECSIEQNSPSKNKGELKNFSD